MRFPAGTALLVLLLLPQASAGPGESSSPLVLSPATPYDLTLVVPVTSHVVLNITLAGATAGVDVSGPGLCVGTLDVLGPTTFLLDCGIVQPANYALAFSSLGAAAGRVQVTGGYFDG